MANAPDPVGVFDDTSYTSVQTQSDQVQALSDTWTAAVTPPAGTPPTAPSLPNWEVITT